MNNISDLYKLQVSATRGIQQLKYTDDNSNLTKTGDVKQSMGMSAQ